MMLTPRLWHALVNPDDYAPLYFQLRLTYRRPLRRFATYDLSLKNILLAIFNIFLAPFFSLVPPIAIFFLGTYWAGFVAGQIQREHSHHRFDLLATLPGGPGDVYWTLAVLYMRESMIYQYVVDGLRITALVGGMVVFVLGSGLSIGLFQPTLSGNEMLELINATLTIAMLFLFLYIQQMQAAVLSQTVGMALTTFTEQAAEARVGASLVFFTIQLVSYAGFAYIAFGIVPDWVGSTVPFTSSLSLLTGGTMVIAVQEVCIALLWRRLHTVYGDIHLERLTAP